MAIGAHHLRKEKTSWQANIVHTLYALSVKQPCVVDITVSGSGACEIGGPRQRLPAQMGRSKSSIHGVIGQQFQ